MLNQNSALNKVQAKYFPVTEEPLKMKAGLHEFGTDFGNGLTDQNFFQQDNRADEYKVAKLKCNPDRHWAFSSCEEHGLLHAKALAWITEKLSSELNISPDEEVSKLIDKLKTGSLADDSQLKRAYTSLSLNIQEDMAILADQPDPGLIMGNVTMPSFWSPEKINGADFDRIHTPVPGFPKNIRNSENMASLIANKGPFVRFVWTVANDNRLDHHPGNGRTSWESGQPLWLRVERQTSVPFEGLGALFIIRTYLYPFDELTDDEKQTLKAAIQNMPEEVSRYKGLWDGKEAIFTGLQSNKTLN